LWPEQADYPQVSVLVSVVTRLQHTRLTMIIDGVRADIVALEKETEGPLSEIIGDAR